MFARLDHSGVQIFRPADVRIVTARIVGCANPRHPCIVARTTWGRGTSSGNQDQKLRTYRLRLRTVALMSKKFNIQKNAFAHALG